MDIEQLKMILETIETMGGDAKEFGIWWLVVMALEGLAGYGLGLVIICMLLWSYISRTKPGSL